MGRAALHFVTITASGLSAGILVMALAVAAAERAVPDDVALRFHRALEPRVDRFNPPLVAVSLVAAVALLVVLRGDLGQPSALWTVLGAVGALVITGTSLGFNMRINRRMRAMPVDPVPPEYLPLRRRWERFHLLRTGGGLLALTAFTLAALTA